MRRFLRLLAAAGVAALAGSTVSAAEVMSCEDCADSPPERVIAACDMSLRAKDIAPNDASAFFVIRAHAFVRLGDTKRALEDLASAIEHRPDDARPFLLRADLLRAAGDADGVIQALTAALRLEPNNVKALVDRADLYRGKQDLRRALSDYSAVLRIDPSHEAAAASRKALAFEIERAGAFMPVKPAPSR